MRRLSQSVVFSAVAMVLTVTTGWTQESGEQASTPADAPVEADGAPRGDAAADSVEDEDGGEGDEAEESGELEFPPEIEALLNPSADESDYEEMVRCIRSREIRNTEILDDQHLIFELTSNRHYLVQFPHRCMGLRRGATIAYETRTGQLCRLDQIRAYEPGWGPPSIPCSIPGFIPVQTEQVALLRDTLKAKRKAGRGSTPAEPEPKPEPKPPEAADEAPPAEEDDA